MHTTGRIASIAALLVTLFVAQSSLALPLVKDGKSEYVIVLPADAIPAEKTAAKELQEHLKLVTGATLPIRSEQDTTTLIPQILVGPSKRAKEILPDQDWSKLSPDGIVMKIVGNQLILAGDRPRGSLYAVYTFLEEIVGVRWWTSTESTIPRRPTLDFPSLDMTYVPKLRYRETFNHDPIQHTTFAARLKVNGHMSDIPESHGGHVSLLGWCHTSFVLIPPGTYFSAHPEWFAQLSGKRQAGTQLCLTDEAMRKELVKNALAWIKKDPSAGIISISQNDCGGPCQCDKCQAIVKEEGSEAGPWIHFVNAVAVEINKDYPNILVETLAYQYTRTPPKKVKPSKNVIVRLCSIECDFAHPLEGTSNASFGNDLRGWSAIAPNLFIWNYVTSFANYMIPHPNMTPFQDDLKFFVNNHVVGVFEQGDAYNEGAGDFLQLRAWLLAHLMWSPERDQHQLRDVFMKGYYGPAAPMLIKYLDMVNDAGRDPNFRLSTYNGDTSFLSPAQIEQATILFDEAAKAVESDPDLSRRVRRERLQVDYLKILRYNFPARVAAVTKNGKKPSASDVCSEFESLANDYIQTAVKFGAKSISEGGSFEAYANSLRGRCAQFIPPTLPTAGAKLSSNEFDAQEDQLTLFSVPTASKLVDDPKASNGKAAFMPGSHTEWAVQLMLKKDSPFIGKGPWKCWIVARVQPGKQPAGAAFQYGLYDQPANAFVARDNATFDLAKDNEYHSYGIFVDELRPGMYFWIAPHANPSAVEGIYIDRIYLERQAK